MVNRCTCAYNIANEFLKLSTAICMSTRPWSDINPDDAHISDLLMSCAQAARAGEPLQKTVQIRLLWPITLCLVVVEQFRSLLEHPLQGDLQRHVKNRVMNIHGYGTMPSQLWKKRAPSLKTWRSALAVLQRNHCQHTLSLSFFPMM